MKRTLAGLLIAGALVSVNVKKISQPSTVSAKPEKIFQQVERDKGWSLTIYRYKGANVIVKEEVTDDGSVFATMVAPSAPSTSADSALAKGLAIIDKGGVK